ncbi:MAG: hypothetical protein HY673_04075 [Chloroflexi bacterium]|nr:hypothetical protein [Chloroflexota bacterium]
MSKGKGNDYQADGDKVADYRHKNVKRVNIPPAGIAARGPIVKEKKDSDPHLRTHMAQIRPDVNMGDLLKTTVSGQLFTVSGSPRILNKYWTDC